MILTPKYCWERVQKHRITLGIQYHGLGTSIGTYMVGNAKSSAKKEEQSSHFFDLSGGCLLDFLHALNVSVSDFRF